MRSVGSGLLSATKRALRPRLNLVIGIVLATGLLSEGVALMAIPSHGTPHSWKLLLSAALVAVSDILVFHLRFGSDNYTLTWSEGAIVVGLILTPWPWVTVVAPVGIIVAQVAARRAPLKILFNASCTAAAAGLAAVCATIANGGHDPVVGGVRAALALSAAATVFFIVNALGVSAAIAAARAMRIRQVVFEGLPLKLSLLVGNTLVALLLLSTPWHGTVLILIPSNLILLYFSYRGYHRATEEGDVWRQLDAAAKELTVLDSAEVCKAAVVRAAHLFNADFAELISYPEGSGGTKLYRFEAATQTLTFDPHVAAGNEAKDSEPASTVEAPLTVATGEAGNVIGALRLGLAGTARLTERRHRVLRTFAHGVATSLQNARLYSEMRYRAEVSAYEAARDPLTGIANRKVLQAELEAALSAATADGTSVGLLLIDLDHFKEINDTLGHHAGDVVLCEVASRLNANVCPGDLVARLGGDEFAILLRQLPNQAHAESEGRRILSALCRPVHHTSYKLAVGGSIGVACYPEDGVNADDLLRRADMALYQAKQVRGAVSRYRSELDDHSVSKITLAGELRQALDSGQFLFLYQPQVSMSTGELTGAEALARWCHPTRGMLPPSDFIDLLERSGLMPDFALYALDQTVRQATVWRSHGLDIPISVNLSARNLLDPSLADAVLDVLARYGMPADKLVVELTETTMVSDVEAMERVLKRLRGIGVQLSVDDFGTGYSSLAFLQRIAVNEIKIDQSFVRTIPHSDSDIAIVRATIDLAHGLGIRVVAEGVETEGHAVMLRDMGCDFAQGWHYGKPVAGAQLLRAWRTRRRHAVHVLDFAHAVTAATA